MRSKRHLPGHVVWVDHATPGIATQLQFDRDSGDDNQPWAGNVSCGRPRVIRNGMPVKHYRYRGTGRPMSPDEARWWLENLADCRICAD